MRLLLSERLYLLGHRKQVQGRFGIFLPLVRILLVSGFLELSEVIFYIIGTIHTVALGQLAAGLS